jgi:hypothetical protein
MSGKTDSKVALVTGAPWELVQPLLNNSRVMARLFSFRDI